jgi:hypothetical protein
MTPKQTPFVGPSPQMDPKWTPKMDPKYGHLVLVLANLTPQNDPKIDPICGS